MYLVVSFEPTFCKSLATFKTLNRFAFKHGFDKTLNKEGKIFDFPKSFTEGISLHITIGFVPVATIISTTGIFIELILEIRDLIVWIVCEKLNLFRQEKDESIIIETE